MYVLDHDLEVALMNVAVMHPNTSIDELLMSWVNRYYDEAADDFELYQKNQNTSKCNDIIINTSDN